MCKLKVVFAIPGVISRLAAKLRGALAYALFPGAHFLLVALIGALAGCSSVGEAINPYGSSFNCSMAENGKCISMTGAYRESLQPQDSKNDGKKKKKAPEPKETDASEASYQGSLYKKLSGLLEEPETPMIAPPKVMRVLLLPYKGTDKELYLYRYAYFVIDDYSWVLGEHVMEGGK